MKKQVKVIRKIDAGDFESALQLALNEGYNLKSSSAFPIDDYATFVAVLIKEKEEQSINNE